MFHAISTKSTHFEVEKNYDKQSEIKNKATTQPRPAGTVLMWYKHKAQKEGKKKQINNLNKFK